MSELEDKLSAVLGNPQLMQQIMNMAQSLGQPAPPSPPPPPKQEQEHQAAPSMPDIDPAMIGRIMSLAGKTGIDTQQKALLGALKPYLSAERLHKLEKAMRAAKLANIVTAILPGGSIPFLSGR